MKISISMKDSKRSLFVVSYKLKNSMHVSLLFNIIM